MKLFLSSILLLMLFPSASKEQSIKDTSLAYIKNPTIPSFKIIQTDSTWFTNENLPKNKPVVIIYFSPDCSHCQYEVKELNKKMDSLSNTFFVWVSYHPMEDIKAFYIKYGLNKFSNVAVGRDPKYFIPAFYKVEFTPFIAVYNSQGKFVKEFREGASPQELMQAEN